MNKIINCKSIKIRWEKLLCVRIPPTNSLAHKWQCEVFTAVFAQKKQRRFRRSCNILWLNNLTITDKDMPISNNTNVYLSHKFWIHRSEAIAVVNEVEQSRGVALICPLHFALTSRHVGLYEDRDSHIKMNLQIVFCLEYKLSQHTEKCWHWATWCVTLYVYHTVCDQSKLVLPNLSSVQYNHKYIFDTTTLVL